MPQQSNDSFEDIAQVIRKHLDDRGWLNNPSRGLAISIALEANELLEHYQWKEEPVGDKQAIAAELADILIYAFQFADANDIDIAAAIRHKLELSAKKYPLSEFNKGISAEERQANWRKRKIRMIKTGEEEQSA